MQQTNSMMKKIHILVIAALLPSFIQAQSDTVFNRTDEQGLKQGLWRKYYSTGVKAYEGWFKDNKPTGEFKRFHENGSLKVILSYRQDSTAWAVFFSPKGNKIAEGKFVGQQKDSLWRYYNPDGTINYDEYYQNGLKNGRCRQYYPDGKLLESAPFTNGKLHGAVIQFFPEGLNKSVVNFNSGIQDGDLKVFYPSGKKRLEGKYANGLKEGEWIFYGENGKITQRIRYVKGVPENYNELLERETHLLDSLMQNAGRIKEPDFDEMSYGSNYP